MHSHDLLAKQLEGEAGLVLTWKGWTLPCSIFPLGTLFSLSESFLSQHTPNRARLARLSSKQFPSHRYKITTEKPPGAIAGIQRQENGAIEWSYELPITCRLSV